MNIYVYLLLEYLINRAYCVISTYFSIFFSLAAIDNSIWINTSSLTILPCCLRCAGQPTHTEDNHLFILIQNNSLILNTYKTHLRFSYNDSDSKRKTRSNAEQCLALNCKKTKSNISNFVC